METNPERIIFYDGECGFCHGFVRCIVQMDRQGIFHYAPLFGDTFKEKIPHNQQQILPETMVLWQRQGGMILRSDAVIEILRILGGMSACCAKIIGIFPRSLRDFGYRIVAKIRRSLAPKPTDVCPMVPSELRKRFLP